MKGINEGNIKMKIKFFLVSIILITLIVLKICNWITISDIILSLTALIILWYTIETQKIRKIESDIASATQINTKITVDRYQRPIVFHCIYTNPKDINDTKFKIVNLSECAVAVQVNCNFKINGEPIDFSPAYNGIQYWNLQYKQEKEGHFSWLDFYLKKGIIDLEKYDDLISSNDEKEVFTYLFLTYGPKDNPIDRLPELTMDVELYCSNEYDQSTYYPPLHYDYKLYKKVWVPIITSDKPYWEYDSKPTWINMKKN